jgi:hypothetical protein
MTCGHGSSAIEVPAGRRFSSLLVSLALLWLLSDRAIAQFISLLSTFAG